MMHVEEPLFPEARPRRDGLLHTGAEVLGHLRADLVQVTFAVAGRKDGRHDARPRRHRLGRVAVRHHEAHLRVGRNDRFQVEVVVRGLEQPPVRGASRLEQLHDPPVVVVGRRHLGGAPPRVVAVHGQRVLLAVERHPEHFAVLDRRVDLVEVHRLELGRHLLVLPRELQPPRIGGLTVGRRRRDRPRLLPLAEAPELRIQRHHVGESGGTGARQSVDVDRSLHRQLRDLRMFAVPRLDLEAVDETPPEVADHADGGLRAEIGIPRDAVEQHVESLPEVARAELVEPGALGRFGHQRVAARIPHHHRPSLSSSVRRDGRDPGTAARPGGGTPPASPPGTGP